MSSILVTGGCGYIATHTLVELANDYKHIVVIDNLSNSTTKSLEAIKEITGVNVVFKKGDIRDLSFLKIIFSEFNIDSVIHFAGLKSVGESTEKPLIYYDVNVCGTLSLLKVMNDFGVKKLVFSSSATVYGIPDKLPIKEDFPRSSVNPYGASKLIVENILIDLAASDKEWRIINLRYFNPVGAHSSGRIGEDPKGIPNNLMPFITQVALGKREVLYVFGDNFDTFDGSGIRDYIHVSDLAKGHVCALYYLMNEKNLSFESFNLGTGKGYSVFEVIKAFEYYNNVKVPFEVVGRRVGDVNACYADASKALEKLNWKAEFGLDRMCIDAWSWQSNNPNGYN